MPPPYRRRRKKYTKPARLSDLVGSHTRRWKLTALHRLEVIRRKWAQAAGEYVARHAVPVRLVRRTLRVAVPDSSWASEMTYLGGPILERLQKLFPWPGTPRPYCSAWSPPRPGPRPDPPGAHRGNAQPRRPGGRDRHRREAPGQHAPGGSGFPAAA